MGNGQLPAPQQKNIKYDKINQSRQYPPAPSACFAGCQEMKYEDYKMVHRDADCVCAAGDGCGDQAGDCR
jgi:hypothetical protein